MILEDRRISATAISETLGISCERVGHNIHNILDVKKLSAKWVPKYLNADQKRIRMTILKASLDRFAAGEARLVIIWFRDHDPQTKQQSIEWRHNDLPRPKKFWTQKSAQKILVSMFEGKNEVRLIKYQPKSRTINI
ncbi:uncharacterized protein LOC106874276 [Octopus bimaculoides]|uniref:uncharacterized protein LOC106874276 n=1 Tax=Octopus bimaculoides TaxID=37653 RepID=UPI00071D5D4A|nr:uncharacterized protein LOC106874276 [Octopus bimaculoides]|eukprot:XP_014777432.1 PREDICTED: uncharacterized protein LOC106874276 [Octopus bimaculoides]